MKCIVMQVEENMAVLLDDKGNFKTVKNNGYSVGQTVYYRNIPARNIYATAASLLVALGLGAGGYKLYYTPVSYLSIEINPSIQLAINVFDRVIGYEYFNDDGKIILDDVNIRNTKSKASVEKIIDKAQVQGYLTSENNSVIIDVVAGNNVLAESLTPLRGQYIPKNVDVVIENASDDDARVSKDNNISIAKAKAVKEYSQSYGGSVEENIEELKEVPVKKLKEVLKSSPTVTAEPIQEEETVPADNSDEKPVSKKNTKSSETKAKPTLRPTAKPVFEGTASGKNKFDSALTDKADSKSEESKEVNEPVINIVPSPDHSEITETQKDNNTEAEDVDKRPIFTRPTFDNTDKSEDVQQSGKNDKSDVSDEKNSGNSNASAPVISTQNKSDNTADTEQDNKHESSITRPSADSKQSESERDTANNSSLENKNRTDSSSDKAERGNNGSNANDADVAGKESGRTQSSKSESGKAESSSGTDKSASDRGTSGATTGKNNGSSGAVSGSSSSSTGATSGNSSSSTNAASGNNSGSSKPSAGLGNGFTKPSGNSGNSSANNAGNTSSDKGSSSSSDSGRTGGSDRQNSSKGDSSSSKSRGEGRSSGVSESSGKVRASSDK